MPFKKGQSGNPKGRTPSAKFVNMLNVALKDGDGKRLRRIADQLVRQAESGEPWAIKEVADRLDGKPQQTVDMNVEHKRTSADWARDELVGILNDSRASSNGATEENGRSGTADSVH